MKIVKVMKGMKKSADRLGAMTSHEESASAETRVLTEVVIGLSFRHSPTPRVAGTAARRPSPPRDVMAPALWSGYLHALHDLHDLHVFLGDPN